MSEPIWIGHDDDPSEEEERGVSAMEQLRPGDVGFGNIGGAAGALIWAGQKIVDATTPEESKFKHVFVVVSNAGGKIRIVQAMPSGAEEIEFRPARWSPDVVFVRPRYHDGPNGYGAVSANVASAARKYIDVPYSWVDYVAIAAHHLRDRGYVPLEQRTSLERYVATSKRMICSQLADQSMADAGWHVFDDGRLPQDVTPAALYRKMMTMPGQYIVGGTNVWRPTDG